MGSEQRNLLDAADVGERVLSRLAAFTQSLRCNAFTIGLKESEDAARVLAGDAAAGAATLRAAFRALFCARRSDWEKFDGIFDAHWLDRGKRRVRGQLAAGLDVTGSHGDTREAPS